MAAYADGQLGQLNAVGSGDDTSLIEPLAA
jgi:hypothetical protein